MSFLAPDFTYANMNGLRPALVSEGINTAKGPVGSGITMAVENCLKFGVSHLTLHFSTKDPSPTDHGYFTPIDMSVEGCRVLGAELLVKFPDRVYQSLDGRNFERVDIASQINCRTLGLVLSETENLRPFYPERKW